MKNFIQFINLIIDAYIDARRRMQAAHKTW